MALITPSEGASLMEIDSGFKPSEGASLMISDAYWLCSLPAVFVLSHPSNLGIINEKKGLMDDIVEIKNRRC